MRRHRFEPARLLLGLLLVGAALAYAMDALGEWQVPTWLLLVLVPASLLAAAFTAVVTFAVRRSLRRRRARAPRAPSVPGAMPMDELRGGYARSGERGGPPGDADDGAGGAADGGPETS